MHKNILNDYLPWDGSHLGSYSNIITERWLRDGVMYYVITLPEGWNINETERQFASGIIYCTAVCTKNVFPCIVEELKGLFGLARRGLHRIIIDNKDYILYYIPITVEGELIWETPLSRLDLQHPMRVDPLFRFEIQKIIAFCDLLALTNTNETYIIIRPGAGTTYVPINSNENNTSIIRQPQNDFSIISKVLFIRWFGEDTALDGVVKDMVGYSFRDNLTVTATRLRDRMNQIISKYDRAMLWYGQFIFNRLSRQLLITH